MPKPAKPKPIHAPPPMPWDGASDDIVADILRRVAALTPGFTAALALQIDRDVREMWGRDRCYIARRAGEGTSERNAKIRRDHRNGERTALLCRRYGLTRQAIHKILTKAEEDDADARRVNSHALPG